MDGILAVWKPEGWTSHDVVAKVRRLLKMKRIGHTGTLDPMVTGVLPLCLGRSTRVVEYVQERPKAYEAVLKLGIATDTEDMTGEVIDRQPVGTITEAEIKAVLERFVGNIEQVPPMFSALKIDGKRLYELAREGKTVERKSRTVTIHEIKLLKVNLELDEPEITFSAVCSKGTYIRTLCVDIGKALGLPATMAKLTRTMSGGIETESCLTLAQIEELLQEGKLEEHLIAADEAITHIDKAHVSSSTAVQVLRGQKVPLSQATLESGDWKQGRLLRIYDSSQLFLGIFQSDVEGMLLRPVKVFN
ncbi:tRNA pseudouridine(55) synthase TruB [Paenibacillus sp. L3-i20]|uniref:tRNA pseudouridine(55) synthase TruB n=1 Tax=Paenibacillus sp. L3-i20 TaxID=2905833 RepID=UPI001EE05B87|nr:tRNA pseudouridine(55) synthase TruB [Paenibacillus sp. L3-i20]GKU78674.1 tRNA pseudouridine synthase B [Paenibacillus sp. L3-i20]